MPLYASRSFASLLIFIFCLSGLDLRAQPRPSFLKWAYQDATSLFKSVDGKTVVYSAGAVGMVSLLSILDRPIQSANKSGHSDFVITYTNITNLVGEPYFAVPAVLGVFGVSLLTKNHKFQDAAFTSAQSLAFASGFTLVLKTLIGRHRPFESASPYKFNPLSGHNATPSGHATAALAILTPWALYYPNLFTWSSVAIVGGGTAIARIVKQKHWFSDVLGGSAIGFATAFLLSRRHQAAKNKTVLSYAAFDIAPLFTPYYSGVFISYQF